MNWGSRDGTSSLIGRVHAWVWVLEERESRLEKIMSTAMEVRRAEPILKWNGCV